MLYPLGLVANERSLKCVFQAAKYCPNLWLPLMSISRRVSLRCGYQNRIYFGKAFLGTNYCNLDKIYANEYLNDRALSELQIEPKKVVEIKVVVSFASN